MRFWAPLLLAVTLVAACEPARKPPPDPEAPATEAPRKSASGKRRHPAPAPEAAPSDQSFGHFAYAEGAGLQDDVCQHADPERRFLHPDAARALARMRDAATADGVKLNPASCFRSIASQRALFECAGGSGAGCVNGRLASPERRATAVAPPGFSEHATGYAVDFFPSAADLEDPSACPSRDACTVSPAFARSLSGRWLAAHAREYGFEQSFFAGSAQGVMVEPWHYRFVGSPEAEVVFQAARAAYPPP